ncbi:MAG: transcriptional regulator [Acidimicrobiales bacterium]|nr:MAG: transcriptional regulator [Acidimicrobiales bacterium]
MERPAVQGGGMATYQQYCPIARATEILAERWSLLIVRNLMFGATTFSAIAQGVPTMSRSMLTKRLRELERAGVITANAKPNGRGSVYGLTDAGADLVEVVDSLGRWAETWVEVLPEHADPGFALWAWCMVQLNREALPAGRLVVAFEFPDQRPGNRFFWLLIHNGTAEVCATDPGGEAELRIVAQSPAFVDWHRGARSWAQALRSGDITITGKRALARVFPTWNTHTPALA